MPSETVNSKVELFVWKVTQQFRLWNPILINQACSSWLSYPLLCLWASTFSTSPLLMHSRAHLFIHLDQFYLFNSNISMDTGECVNREYLSHCIGHNFFVVVLYCILLYFILVVQLEYFISLLRPNI